MKKRVLISLIFCFIPLLAFSRPSVALVLSGGGARGYVHIATLRMIEKYGIPVDYVVGTSMGAIIGGLFAAGYSSYDIEKAISEHNIPDAVFNLNLSKGFPVKKENDNFNNFISLSADSDVNIGTTGVVNDIKILCILDELLSLSKTTHNFDELPLSFRAVAVNVVNGKTEVLKSGDLVTAIRASMGIPMAFPIFEREGKFLVDGGVNNNMPVDVAIEEFHPDIIISSDCTNAVINKSNGSDLEARLRNNESSINDILNQISSISDASLYSPSYIRQMSDISIFYDTTAWSIMSFNDVYDIIDFAHSSAEQYSNEFERLSNSFDKSDIVEYKREGMYFDITPPLISAVVSKGNERYRTGVAKSIVGEFDWIIGKRLTKANLEALSKHIKMVADFYNVSTFYYTLDETENGCVMNLHYDFPIFKPHQFLLGLNAEFSSLVKINNQNNNKATFNLPIGISLKYSYLLSNKKNLDSISLSFLSSSLFENTSFTISYSHLFNLNRRFVGFAIPFLRFFANSPSSITALSNLFTAQNYGVDTGLSFGYFHKINTLDITLGLTYIYFGKGDINSSKRSMSLLPNASLSLILGTIQDTRIHYSSGYHISLKGFVGIDPPIVSVKSSGDISTIHIPYSIKLKALGVYQILSHLTLSMSAECGVSRRAYDITDGFFEYGGTSGMPGFGTGSKVHDFYIASLALVVPFFEHRAPVNPAFSFRVAVGQHDEINKSGDAYDAVSVPLFSSLKPVNVGVEGALIVASDIIEFALCVGYEFTDNQISVSVSLK